ASATPDSTLELIRLSPWCGTFEASPIVTLCDETPACRSGTTTALHSRPRHLVQETGTASTGLQDPLRMPHRGRATVRRAPGDWRVEHLTQQPPSFKMMERAPVACRAHLPQPLPEFNHCAR